jgi:hypothetical protein
MKKRNKMFKEDYYTLKNIVQIVESGGSLNDVRSALNIEGNVLLESFDSYSLIKDYINDVHSLLIVNYFDMSMEEANKIEEACHNAERAIRTLL